MHKNALFVYDLAHYCLHQFKRIPFSLENSWPIFLIIILKTKQASLYFCLEHPLGCSSLTSYQASSLFSLLLFCQVEHFLASLVVVSIDRVKTPCF